MARVFLKRTLRGFEPADTFSQEAMARIRIGDIVRADVARPRNYQFHKLVMSLLMLTFDNQDRYTEAQMFRRAVAYAAGYVREYVTLDGEARIEARSLAYDDTSEDEAREVFPRLMSVCAGILRTPEPDLAREVEMYAAERFAA